MEKETCLLASDMAPAKVTFFSTMDGNGTVNRNIRTRHSDTGFRQVVKLNVVVNYNEFMEVVELLDQNCVSYMFFHKCSKWYFAIHIFCSEVGSYKFLHTFLCRKSKFKDVITSI